jgi:hypothetical protein
MTAQALGYVRFPADAREGLERVVASVRRDLAACAERAIHELAGVFADPQDGSAQGFHALVVAVQRREDVAAVVVPRMGDLGQASCLSGADVRTAERYLRARAVHAEDAVTTRTPIGVPSTSVSRTGGSSDARSAVAAARRDPAMGRADATSGGDWEWR